MDVRAGIVVTGTEVLTGRVADRNGPWLSERLAELGVDVAHVVVVGDRPADLEAALRFLAAEGLALVVTSGGLGPTEDDLTMDVVAAFQGREVVFDAALDERVWGIVSGLRARWRGLDEEAMRSSARKQAHRPAGATVLDPVGTAPGHVVAPASGDGPLVVVLPGPPGELQAMWPQVRDDPAFGALAARAPELREGTLRLFGVPESEIALTLREARAGGVDVDALEITTCLRGGEVEVVTRFGPEQQGLYDAFAGVVAERHADTLFSSDGTTVDEQVAAALLAAGATIATAESCTGGLLAARLTARAGSSAYVLGGVVAYANEVKAGVVGVPAALIERVGAVSEEVAAALADGAIAVLGADVGVGITGVAGPGGGTEAEPVGFVCFCAAHRDGRRLTRAIRLPGSRADVRERSVSVALHLVRRLLAGEG